MRIFELILQNVEIKKIAEDAVKTISNSPDSISHVTVDFLHSISDAFRFRYYVTAEELAEMKFNWPEEHAVIFRFTYEQSPFELYKKFLQQFCATMLQQGCQEQLIKIMEAFIQFSSSMDLAWAENFYGPFSLIGLCLLQEIHKHRKEASDDSSALDTICKELFEVTRKGLGFEVSHNTIAKGLGVLLETDYDYFWKVNNNVFQFFIDCLDYEIAGTSGQTFNYMRKALESKRIAVEPRDAFVRFLIDPELIDPWCGLCMHQSKNLVRSLLKFLNTLLKFLPILECFTRHQAHTIFRCALQTNAHIGLLAVQFYIGFMKRNFKDKFILRDILDFYLTASDGIDDLDKFVTLLWDEFPYISYFDPYLRILKKTEWQLDILCVTAQFTYEVYKKLYNECEDNSEFGQRLSKFLLALPPILNALQDKWQVRGILSQVYSITVPETALITIKDFPIAADGYVKYALNCLNNKVEDYKITLHTVTNMLDLMDYFNNDEELEFFSNNIHVKYRHLMTNLSELTESQAKQLEHVLVIISGFTSDMYDINEESIFEIFSDLVPRLVNSKILQELSSQYNCFIDVFAVSTCNGCMKILSYMVSQMASDDNSVETEVLLGLVEPFSQYIAARLDNEDQPKATLLFAEASIRALCDIYLTFNIELKREMYHVLVNCVNSYVFEIEIPDKDQHQLDLQRRILSCFNYLHKYIEIPTSITWKIAIHFGLRPEFETELNELLDILFAYKTEKFEICELFINTVPVAIYNLHKRKVKFHTIQKALSAYKKYIEAKMSNEEQLMMKLHIIMSIIGMIEKAIEAGNTSQESNRLELLTSMGSFLNDVSPDDSKIIVDQSKKLLEYNLSLVERDTLLNFQKRILK